LFPASAQVSSQNAPVGVQAQRVAVPGGAPVSGGEDWASIISGEVAANSPEVADAHCISDKIGINGKYIGTFQFS